MKPIYLIVLLLVSASTGFCSANSKEVSGKYIDNVYYGGELLGSQLSEENLDQILEQKNRVGRFSITSNAVEFGLKVMKDYEEYAMYVVFGRRSAPRLRFTRNDRVLIVSDSGTERNWIFFRKEGFDPRNIEAIRAALNEPTRRP